MDERDHAQSAPARRAVDELDAVALETRERGPEVVDHVAHVVERGPAALGDETTNPRIRVDRLDELEALSLVADECDADPLVGDLAHRRRGQAERVAIEGKRVFDARNGDRDVMKTLELHERGGR